MTLLPCPFCGGKPKVVRCSMSTPGRYYVECESCAMTPYRRGGDDEQEAIANWNARPVERAAAEKMREACLKEAEIPDHRTNREWDIKVEIERRIHALDIDRVLEAKP